MSPPYNSNYSENVAPRQSGKNMTYQPPFRRGEAGGGIISAMGFSFERDLQQEYGAGQANIQAHWTGQQQGYGAHQLNRQSTSQYYFADPSSSSEKPAEIVTTGISAGDFNTVYLEKLRGLIPSKEALQKRGYKLEQMSKSQLEAKMKCVRCDKYIRPLKGDNDQKDKVKPGKRKAETDENNPRGPASSSQARGSAFGQGTFQEQSRPETASAPAKQTVIRCKFHNGVLVNRKWTCCGNHVSLPPCGGAEFHTARVYAPGKLEEAWQYYPTPTLYQSLPSHRIAVAIDCEMGTSKNNETELIRVTLIDYFTSEVLVDSLVWPNVPMLHFNTRFSGVTAGQMNQAKRTGNCFMGRQKALEACWKFVGTNTVVVGHGCQNDLAALRWIHDQVVDTYLIEEAKWKEAMAEEEENAKKEAEQGKDKPAEPKQKKPKGTGPLTLKTLIMQRLGRVVQNAGRAGHDSLEDAVAARDLAHWNVVNKDL